MEYFAYKKLKKSHVEKDKVEQDNQNAKDEAPAGTTTTPTRDAPTEKKTPARPVLLTDDDELFFERITSEDGYSDEAGKRPPLPPRGKTPDISWEDSDVDEAPHKGDHHDDKTAATTNNGNNKGKGKAPADKDGKWKKAKSLSTAFFVRKNKSHTKDGLEPNMHLAVPEAEEEREKEDISRVLDDLNFSAKNNKTFSLSQESAEMVGKFTIVLKDLVNGAPTAIDDLKALLDDHDGVLAKNYEKLPSSMKKMVTTLPNKLTTSLAPELLAVAAEAQGLSRDVNASKGGLKEQAMKLVVPKNLSELVTKPSAIVGMLKAIVNALKLRWPAFIGTNVIWSIALSRE